MHASTLNGLMLVLAVSENGSINKAASALNISQPSLTRALRLFEGRIGGEVFVRTAKGVVLTPLGETLVEHARAIRKESQRAQQTINGHVKSQSRFLTIGVVRVHPLVSFSEALLDFHKSNPDVRIQLIYGTPDEVFALLRNGDVEIVFSSLSDSEAGLVQEVLFLDEVGIYASHKSRFASRSSVTAAELRDAAWVLGLPGTPARDSLLKWFEMLGEAFPAVSIEADDTQIRRELVCKSDLVSTFHFHHVQKEVELGALVRIGAPLPQTARPIGVISIGTLSRLAATFCQCIKARYAKTGLVPLVGNTEADCITPKGNA